MAVVSIVTGSEPDLIDSPNCEVAHITVANTGDHYFSRKFTKITEVIIQCNHTTAGYSDEFYSAYPDTTVPNKVIIVLAGSDTTSVPCTLLIFGEP